MKRTIFLPVLLLMLFGGADRLVADEEYFPMMWLAVRYLDAGAYANQYALMIDSSRVRGIGRVLSSSYSDTISNHTLIKPIIETPLKTQYVDGGYLSRSASLIEHYPAQCDFDSLAFWYDFSDQLADSISRSAKNIMHAYGVFTTNFDGNTQHKRIRQYPGIQYMCKQLKTHGLKTSMYAFDRDVMEILDNTSGYGMDFRYSIPFEIRHSDDPINDNEDWQLSLGQSSDAWGTKYDGRWCFVPAMDRNCTEMRELNAEYWLELSTQCVHGGSGKQIRYPTLSELWVQANLALAYGVRGFTFHHFNSNYGYWGVARPYLPSNNPPVYPAAYMTEAQRNEVFGSGSGFPYDDSYTIFYDVYTVADKLQEVGLAFRKLEFLDAKTVWRSNVMTDFHYVDYVSASCSRSSSDTYFEVGVFNHPQEAHKYFMIVNRLCASSDNVTYTIKLLLPSGYYDIYDIYTSKTSPIKSNITTNSVGILTFTDVLNPGHAALYKVVWKSGKLTSPIPTEDGHATQYNTGRKLIGDRTGGLHLCYGKKDYVLFQGWSVCYAYSGDNGQTWSEFVLDDQSDGWIQESEDNAQWATTPALALDKNDNPYVIYKNQPSSGIRMIDVTGCRKQQLINDICAYECPSLAIDTSTNMACIAFKKSYRLRVMRFNVDQSSWPTSYSTISSMNIREPCVVSVGSDKFVISAREYKMNREKNTYIWAGLYPGSLKNLGFKGKYPSLGYGNDGYVYLVYVGGPGNQEDSRYVYLRKAPVYRNSSGAVTGIGSFSSAEVIYYESNGDFAHPEIVDGMTITWHDNEYANGVIMASYRTSSGGWSNRVTLSNQGNCYGHSGLSYDNLKGFHCWTKHYTNPKQVVVTDFNFSSKGWNVRVVYPNGGEVLTQAKKRDIVWEGWAGGSRDWKIEFYGNKGWHTITPSVHTEGFGPHKFSWYVGQHTDPFGWDYGDHCKVRITEVNNPTYTDMSDADFVIKKSIWIWWMEPAGGSNLMGYQPPGGGHQIPWKAQSSTGFDGVDFEFSPDGGITWISQEPQQLMLSGDYTAYDSTLIDTLIDTGGDTTYLWEYDGAIPWTVPNEPTTCGKLRLIAYDTCSQSDTYTFPDSIFIPLAGIHANSTRSDQMLMSSGLRYGLIGIAYTSQLTDTSAPVIYYTESGEGLKLDPPDSIGVGIEPTQIAGCVSWLAENRKSVKYSYWDDAIPAFSAPTDVFLEQPSVLFNQYSTTDMALVGDTVHVVTLSKIVVEALGGIYHTKFALEHLSFLKDQPGSPSRDSIFLGELDFIDTTSLTTISMDIQAANLLTGFSYRDTCYYMRTPLANPSVNDVRIIGTGFCPKVSADEGNITYSYLATDSSSIIRLWGYRDDTVWIETDTIALGYDASCMAEAKGFLYNVQRGDTALSYQYGFDLLCEELLLEKTYPGFYTHSFPDKDSCFSRVDCYTSEYDSAVYCFMTTRTPLNSIYPALYIEADDRRSPYTVWRDTCVHYTYADVDYGSDSLVYLFPHLDPTNDYKLIVEFYSESDSITELVMQTGTNQDTIQIPDSSFSWYEESIPSGTDTLALKIRRLSGDYVPVSRVIVRQRSQGGIHLMGGIQSDGPVQIPFCLYQPFPNPFGNAATIRYSLPYATHVSLKIYDVSGRMVTRLVDGQVDPGVHELRWKGKDNFNRKCASGVYFVRFQADEYQASKKMVLLR